VAAAVAQRPGCAVFSHFVAINGVLSLIEGEARVIVFRPDHTSCSTLEIENGDLKLAQLGAAAVTQVN
jgi:broad specificity phosphatase PhoE